MNKMNCFIISLLGLTLITSCAKDQESTYYQFSVDNQTKDTLYIRYLIDGFSGDTLLSPDPSLNNINLYHVYEDVRHGSALRNDEDLKRFVTEIEIASDEEFEQIIPVSGLFELESWHYIYHSPSPIDPTGHHYMLELTEDMLNN